MGTDQPSWVPGEEGRHVWAGLHLDVTGLYGDLPPGAGPLLEVAGALIARAFAAYAEGDWETCDGLVAEGRAAAGGIFTAVAEHVVSPAFPYRVADPSWDAFLARLAVTVLSPGPSAPRPPDPAPPAEPISLADELRAMGLM